MFQSYYPNNSASQIQILLDSTCLFSKLLIKKKREIQFVLLARYARAHRYYDISWPFQLNHRGEISRVYKEKRRKGEGQ